ncbi:MAG: MarR family transcriptional regulator [Erythrobacter sp.]|nr:MarR family transcriptional regulator [Erythrobacter sp.]
MAIARQLREGEFQLDQTPPDPGANPIADKSSMRSLPAEGLSSRSRYAQLARETYARRRQRGAIFGNSELFGEPAWDILLDLYIALVEEKAVSVSSACIGSASPPTTGLRWLGVLAENELVVREQDPNDQRRVLVRLTEFGVAAMDRYFASVDGSH